MFDAFGRSINQLTLVPASGGVFELEVDGQLLYSKKATGQHTDPETLVALVREREAR